MVKEDSSYHNLTKEQEQEMKAEVMALRQQKKVGARPTNRSAALDYRQNLTALNDEVSSVTTPLLTPLHLLSSCRSLPSRRGQVHL
jgi:hypothetical protein